MMQAAHKPYIDCLSHDDTNTRYRVTQKALHHPRGYPGTV